MRGAVRRFLLGQLTSLLPDVVDFFLTSGYVPGIPTRYGNQPSQWRAFWDGTGGLWAKGVLAGKYAGVFVSTAGLGGGQEATALNSISTLTHHGIIYVPLGYSHAFELQANIDEVHGGE